MVRLIGRAERDDQSELPACPQCGQPMTLEQYHPSRSNGLADDTRSGWSYYACSRCDGPALALSRLESVSTDKLLE